MRKQRWEQWAEQDRARVYSEGWHQAGELDSLIREALKNKHFLQMSLYEDTFEL